MVGRLGSALGGSFRVDESAEILDAALERLGDIDDPAALAWLKYFVGQNRSRQNRFEEALPLQEQVLTTAEHLGITQLLVRALASKGNVLFAMERRREARALTTAAREVASESGSTELELRALSGLATQWAEWDLRRANELTQEGISLARRSGHRGTLLSFIGNLGYTGFLAGEWASASAQMDAALGEDLSPRDLLQILNNDIIIHSGLGDDVSGLLEELKATASDMSGPLFRAFVADPSANIALARGDLTEALRQFKELIDADPSQLPEYSYRAAHVAIWAGELEQARDLFETFTAAGGMGEIHDARIATLKAGIAALEGQQSDALPLYREAFRHWRAVGAVWDEAMTGMTIAQLLDHDDPDVAEVITSTRAILERLRAKPYLERLDSVVASEKHAKPGVKRATAKAVAAAD